MKRVLPILLSLLIFTIPAFAQNNDGDDYDDDYVYEINGPGDQFVKADFSALIPLNLDNKLYVGGGFTIGYYRFMTNKLAIGAEVSPSYNVSIGAKSLIQIPITFGAIFQPTIGKFEFPLGISAGISSTTFSNTITYFPAFTMKAYGGCFYRINDSWSAGISSSFMWIPEWFADPTLNYNGLFLTAGLSIRYHF